ncbi:6-phosphogluconate dehydrogenase [Arachidicoccus ginsenosidimutans]|uniref:NAD(P)-dependent oxidoreductase n=1 Tax=Arachidicoccus sp. BS20 TaxID=1850526 RepID=UPI0007F06D16|nr:NAD(P)-dependent oxidoreductase [Arachidicoccus sp. BS20]ANI90762.1 6-phosphogluconate dehydrogenase [Arachidicoccus sp. BS20]
MNKTKIGWIGFGTMGNPMAKHLIDAGFSVSVFNHNKAKDAIAKEAGASVSDTPEALVEQSDIIFLMVTDDNATRQIFESGNGIFSTNVEGKIFINMSSVSPNISKEMAEKCLQKNAHYLDAPVSGSVKQATEASLVIMVGGDENIFQQTKPLFEKLGKLILYIGETGSANALKLVVNTLLAIHAQGLAEAVAFAEKNNIDVQNLLTVLNNGAMANIFMKLKGDIILNNDYKPAFSLKNIVKDLSLAKGIGLDFPLGNASFETYQKAKNDYAEEDMIAVYKYLKGH